MKHSHAGKSSLNFFKPEELFDIIDIKQDMIVLDAGCGQGDISESISQYVSKVISVDQDEESIDILKNKNIKNINAVIGDINNIEFIDNSLIDICFLINVLHGFVANKEKNAIDELERVIKKNSQLVIVEFKKDASIGPPKEIKLSKEEVKNIFSQFEEKAYKEFEFHYEIVLFKI